MSLIQEMCKGKTCRSSKKKKQKLEIAGVNTFGLFQIFFYVSISIFCLCQFSYLYLYLSVTVSTDNAYCYIPAFIHQSEQLCHEAFFLILHFQLKLCSITTTNDSSMLPKRQILIRPKILDSSSFLSLSYHFYCTSSTCQS